MKRKKLLHWFEWMFVLRLVAHNQKWLPTLIHGCVFSSCVFMKPWETMCLRCWQRCEHSCRSCVKMPPTTQQIATAPKPELSERKGGKEKEWREEEVCTKHTTFHFKTVAADISSSVAFNHEQKWCDAVTWWQHAPCKSRANAHSPFNAATFLCAKASVSCVRANSAKV